MGDRYQVDIGSMGVLIEHWEGGAQVIGGISQQLSATHDQLEGAASKTLVEGLLAEVPVSTCIAKVAAAKRAASAAAQGLSQDTSTLRRNLSAYREAEREAEARLKAVHEAEREKKRGFVGGGTRTSGRGPSLPGTGHGGSSAGGGPAVSAEGGGRGGRGGTLPSPGPPRYADEAQVEQWIDQAFQVLEANGAPADELDGAGVLLIIEHESSGNPNAVNNWDSNAQAGDPSRGLMQTIGATFEAYKLPGHDDIYNPVDNIIAGVRYAIARYGSIQNVPGVESVTNGGSYVGY